MTGGARSLASLLAAVAAGCDGTGAPTYDELASRVRAAPLAAETPAIAPNVFGDVPSASALNASNCLHALSACGLELELSTHAGELVRVLDVLTSSTLSKRVLGGPTLIRSRTGVRFPELDRKYGGLGDHSHRGFGLAALGSFGLTLDLALEVDGDAYTLRDVLRDTLAEFDLRQRELEWSAEALARWLPPHARWRIRFGMECSLDALAVELLERGLEEASCGGVHLLSACTTLRAAHRSEPYLSADVVRRLDARIDAARSAALESQASDGSWTYTWLESLIPVERHKELPPNHSQLDVLLVTGHLAEWLDACCSTEPPVRAALARAGGWLHGAVLTANRADAWANFCPYTHAVRMAREHGPATPLSFSSNTAGSPDPAVFLAPREETHPQ